MRCLHVLTRGCLAGAAALCVHQALAQTPPPAQPWLTVPRKAGLLSAVVPGAGQVYNHQLWKLPLVAATLGGATYMEVRYWQRYREYKQGREARQQRANGNLNAVDLGPRSGQEPSDWAQEVRFTTYRTLRDQWLGITAGVYALQILDAVTAAHLRDFDVSENLALRMHPTLLATATTPVPGLQLRATLRRPASLSPVSEP